MIEFSQPISFREDFSPSPKEPFYLLHSFSFFLRNIFSIGILGAVKEVSGTCHLTNLQFKQLSLQSQAVSILKRCEELQVEFDVLKDLVDKEQFENVNHRLEKLQTNSNFLTQIKRENEKAAKSTITSIAVRILIFLGGFLKNIITLGVYGIYRDFTLRNRIKRLEKENTYIETTIEKKLKVNSVKRFQQQIDLLSKKIQLKQNLLEIKETETGKAYFNNKIIQTRFEKAQDEYKQVNNSCIALKANQINLELNKQNIEQSLQQKNAEIEKLKQEQIHLCEILIPDLEDLKSKESQLKEQVKKFQRKVESTNQLEGQTIGLQQQINSLSSLQRIQPQLGPITPKYEKRVGDGIVEGACGIDINKTNAKNIQAIVEAVKELGEDIPSNSPISERVDSILISDGSLYAQRVNDKYTAAEILKAEFDYAFDTLLRMGRESMIHFNESAAIYQDAQYSSNRATIFSFMALDLIKEGKLDSIGNNKYHLCLNNRNVSMRSSDPERVQSYRIDANTAQRMPTTSIIFKQIDEFTPAIEDLSLPLGIDPAGAKWAYNRLTLEEQTHLFYLLMDPLIPNDNIKLQETKKFMKQANKANVDLVRIAYELIFDIGVAINKKFDAKGVFANQWKQKAFNESGVGEEGYVIPLKKEIISTDNEAVCLCQPVVEWKPNIDSILMRNKFLKGGKNFMSAFELAKSRYQKIYANLSNEVVGNRDKILYISKLDGSQETYQEGLQTKTINIKGINTQYHTVHKMLGSHGCLMSNLLAVLIGRANSLNADSVQVLKNLMAAYLNQQEVADQFKREINSAHHLTIAKYQSWLKGENPNYLNNSHLSDVEIKLVANLFGVRFAVFRQNGRTKLNEYGLTVPAEDYDYYGPNTKEIIFMYNDTKYTYRSLWPKLKPEMLPQEARFACEEMNDYIKKIDDEG